MAKANGKGKGLDTTFTPALDILLAKYGPMTAVVYGYIWRRSQGERQRCDSKRETIKKLLHIDEKTFTTHARKLARDGYVRYQERGNSSTIYWTTGKAETENASFSVENFPTKRDSSEEFLPESGEIFPTSEEIFPNSEENLPTQQGNIPHDDSIKESSKETKKETEEEERQNPSSSVFSSSKEHPAIALWLEVVKPARLSEKNKAAIIEGLGENPCKEDLQKAVQAWQEYARGRTNASGKPYSLTFPDGILEKYQEITKRSNETICGFGFVIDPDGQISKTNVNVPTRRQTLVENQLKQRMGQMKQNGYASISHMTTEEIIGTDKDDEGRTIFRLGNGYWIDDEEAARLFFTRRTDEEMNKFPIYAEEW